MPILTFSPTGMSYQVLARKYRPRNFDSLVGQDHVVRALTHALEQKRLHHAYLFTGTRGVGKTTLSRALLDDDPGIRLSISVTTRLSSRPDRIASTMASGR